MINQQTLKYSIFQYSIFQRITIVTVISNIVVFTKWCLLVNKGKYHHYFFADALSVNL